MQRALAILVMLSVTFAAYPRSVRGRIISTLPLEELVAGADVIAQVRIVAVDEEIAYPPLARAKVEEAFKGTKAGDTLLIDAWSVTEVGAVFLVFLDDTHQAVKEQLQSRGSTFVTDPDACYYTIHEGLDRQVRVRLTWAFGELDVGVSFPSESVSLPRELEQVQQNPPDRPAEVLVRQEELYRMLRDRG